jgi:hypothetical protein
MTVGYTAAREGLIRPRWRRCPRVAADVLGRWDRIPGQSSIRNTAAASNTSRHALDFSQLATAGVAYSANQKTSLRGPDQHMTESLLSDTLPDDA